MNAVLQLIDEDTDLIWSTRTTKKDNFITLNETKVNSWNYLSWTILLSRLFLSGTAIFDSLVFMKGRADL